jgi:hypothetical protein
MLPAKFGLINGAKLGRKHLCKVLYYSKMVNLILVELCTQLMHHMKIYKKEISEDFFNISQSD